MRIKNKLILSLGIVLLLSLPLAYASPSFFGDVASNGNIIGISQSGFLGQNSPISNGQTISDNVICLTFYNIHTTTNVSIAISYYQEIGNKTVEIRSQTLNLYMPQFQIINDNVSLYLFKGSYIVDMTYDNVNFTFQYSPVNALFPVHINNNGELAFYSIILLGIGLFVFVLGTLTSEFMIRKMLYFPKMSLSAYFLAFLLGFVAIFVLFNAIYLKILSIPYYYFVIPLFFMSIAIELQLRRGKAKEAIFFGMTDSGKIDRIFINKDKESKSKEYYTGKIPVIDDDIYIGKKKNQTIVIDSTSFIKAFKRLFGFYTYLEMPLDMIEYPNIDDTRIYYFCSIVNDSKKPMLELVKSEYHFFRNRKLNKPKTYKINTSSNAHIGDVISVMTDLKQIDSLAKENNLYAKENKELHAQIQNGAIKADYKFILEAAKLLKPMNKLIPDFKEKQEAENEDNKDKEPDKKQDSDSMEGMYQ